VKMLPEHRIGNVGVPGHSLLQATRSIEIEIPLVTKDCNPAAVIVRGLGRNEGGCRREKMYFRQHEHLHPAGNEIVANALRPFMGFASVVVLLYRGFLTRSCRQSLSGLILRI